MDVNQYDTNHNCSTQRLVYTKLLMNPKCITKNQIILTYFAGFTGHYRNCILSLQRSDNVALTQMHQPSDSSQVRPTFAGHGSNI